MRRAKGKAVNEAVDPLRKFFDDLGHRIDLYPALTPAGQAWPTLETFDLYNAWLRFNQQRRELRIREEQAKTLHAELKRRDCTAAEQECGPGRNVSDEPKLWSASRPCDRFATENDRKSFLGMFPGDELDQFAPEFAAYVRTGELAGEQPQIPAWDIAALEQLSPADRIDYITDRLAADFKNKTTNVGVAILLLRNLAKEMRETSSPALAAPKHSEPEEPLDRLVRLTEAHLREQKAANFSAPLVDRLRRDNCTHDWSASKPLSGYHDEIECLKCGLHVIDGYRPYYPKGNGS